MTNLLTAASLFRSLGMHFFPAKTDGSKEPVWQALPKNEEGKPTWSPYKTRLATDEELIEWFEKNSYNIAVICGQSGFAAIDDDSYKAQGGQIKLASTLYQTTPSGGTHHLYKCPEGLRPSVNEKIAVDIRAFDSYIVVAPSANNGVPYKWNVGTQKEFIEAFKNLPGLPLAYLEKIQPKKENGTPGGTYDIGSAFGVKDGGRHSKIKSAIVSLANKYDKATAWKFTETINLTYLPPLGPDDLKKTFEHSYDWAKNNPSEVSPTRQSEPIPQNVSLAREDRLEKVKQIFKEGYKEGIKTGFPSLDKIIHGLQAGQTYLIFADTNTGKSVFTLNILSYIARQGIATAYFDLENAADLTHERFILINNPGMTKQKFDILLKEKNLDKYVDEIKGLGIDSWSLDEISDRFGVITYEAIESIIKEDIEKGIRVFCIDHLHYFEPSQTDYAKLGDIARKLNTLAAKEHLIILFVAHTKKGMSFEKDGKVFVKRPTMEDVSGSKLIISHTKNVISLSRNEQSDDPLERMQTTVYVNKQKTGSTGKFNLVFNPENLTFKDYAIYPVEKPLSLLPEGVEVKSEEKSTGFIESLEKPKQETQENFIEKLEADYKVQKEKEKLADWEKRVKPSEEAKDE